MDSTEKTVKYDSSQETKKRINSLIILLHRAALKSPDVSNPNLTYLSCLDRLYIECRAKLSSDEKKELKSISQEIEKIKADNFNNLCTPYLCFGTNRRRNTEYIKTWNSLMNKAREFEIMLMEFLDRHNFLLREDDNKRRPH